MPNSIEPPAPELAPVFAPRLAFAQCSKSPTGKALAKGKCIDSDAKAHCTVSEHEEALLLFTGSSALACGD